MRQQLRTPVEFAEKSGKIYVNTRKNSWKVKRIRGNQNAQIAPCTIRGKIIGKEMVTSFFFVIDPPDPQGSKVTKKLPRGNMYNDYSVNFSLVFLEDFIKDIVLYLHRGSSTVE